MRRPKPGAPAGLNDLRRAQHQQQVLRNELARVRTAATAWRNGLGGLLAGLVGFSLIKGRSDISGLTQGAAAIVGILLLLALVVGAVGALQLLRAAHGRPSVVAVGGLPPAPISEHQEALISARKLRLGVIATVSCSMLLVAAVALTWYGPPRARPQLRVEHDGVSSCGSVVRVSAGMLVVRTRAGEESLALGSISGVEPVASC